MWKFTLLPLIGCAFFFALYSVAGHSICYYSSVSLEKADKENKCRKFCANFKSNTTGQCFAYRFDSRLGLCAGYVFDHRSKYVDYTHCGANYGEKLDFKEDDESPDGEKMAFKEDDESPDGVYDYQDGSADVNDYYADLADVDDYYAYPASVDDYYSEPASVDDYYDAYTEEPGNTEPEVCDLKSVTLGVASTEKICEESCASFREENSSELYGGCAAWFWNPNNEQCEGLLSQKGGYGYDRCGTVKKESP